MGSTLGDLIFVLGVGRSGTSALTRVLSLCGAYLPSPLTEAGVGNEKGHFEPSVALECNDRFLRRIGLTWYDPTVRLQSGLSIPQEVAADLRGEIDDFLAAHAGMSPLVIKEPRITALTPYWFAAAAAAGWTIKIVVAVRHPCEVQASLSRRDGISGDLADALWLKYNLLAEKASRPYQRVFVDYNDLLADWEAEVRRIANCIAVRLSYDQRATVAAFLDGSLRHHDVPREERIANPWLSMIYSELRLLRTATIGSLRQLDTAYDLFVSAESMFRQAHREVDLALYPVGVCEPVARPLSKRLMSWLMRTVFSRLRARPGNMTAVEPALVDHEVCRPGSPAKPQRDSEVPFRESGVRSLALVRGVLSWPLAGACRRDPRHVAHGDHHLAAP